MEYIKLTEIYGMASYRLIRMLRAERAGGDQLEAYFKEQIHQTIQEITQELGLDS